MNDDMLLVAIGCGRLPGILDIAGRAPFVVFGAMDGGALAGLASRGSGDDAPRLPVCFYETG